MLYVLFIGREEADTTEIAVEEAKSGEFDLGNLDISGIQDELYAGLDEGDLDFKQAIMTYQIHEASTAETYDSESFHK